MMEGPTIFREHLLCMSDTKLVISFCFSLLLQRANSHSFILHANVSLAIIASFQYEKTEGHSPKTQKS